LAVNADIYLWLPNAEHAIGRVAQRVRAGGHNIPEAVIRRRYKLGVVNMRDHYLPLADIASIEDTNDGRKVIATRSPEDGFVVYDQDRWASIESLSL